MVVPTPIVTRQAFGGQPRALARDPVQHEAAAMGRQAIPQQHHPAAGFKLMHIAEELDQGFAVVGARTELEYEMGIAGIGLEHQRRSQ